MYGKLSNGLAKADELANGLTDDEIIKSLKSCFFEHSCKHCNYRKIWDGSSACINKMLEDAFNLVNRLNARIIEIEEVELKAMRGAANSYKMHYEQLQENSSSRQTYKDENINIAHIKAEAVREFAERLKGHRNGDFIFVSTKLLDNLVKEMAGDTDER